MRGSYLISLVAWIHVVEAFVGSRSVVEDIESRQSTRCNWGNTRYRSKLKYRLDSSHGMVDNIDRKRSVLNSETTDELSDLKKERVRQSYSRRQPRKLRRIFGWRRKGRLRRRKLQLQEESHSQDLTVDLQEKSAVDFGKDTDAITHTDSSPSESTEGNRDRGQDSMQKLLTQTDSSSDESTENNREIGQDRMQKFLTETDSSSDESTVDIRERGKNRMQKHLDRENGRRLEFKNSKKATKSLSFDKLDRKHLFHEYMRSSPDSFSDQSFYKNTDKKVRRWSVRKLNSEECATYRSSTNLSEDRFRYELMESKGNYFRFSIPLLPIVGIDLTPIIDAFVYHSHDIKNEEENSIYVQSVRVSLLSDSFEISDSKEFIDGDESMKKLSLSMMAPEVINTLKKLKEIISPRMVLTAKLYWSVGNDSSTGQDVIQRFRQSKKARLGVDTNLTTSFTIPSSLPVNIPGIVIRKFCSGIVQKILSTLLPKLLKQIEDDFMRWRIDDASDEA